MHFNVKLLGATRTEKELGQIARFCHTPVGTKLDESNIVNAAIQGDEERPTGAETQPRAAARNYETLAVSCFRRKHMSVFEFAELLYDITCPIYVARQLFRHRNGTFMEKSLRYLEPPKVAQNGEYDAYDEAYREAVTEYNLLVGSGERKERARAVLPLCTPTEFLWRISLRSLFNVFDQRLGKTAQEETRTVVKAMYDLAFEKYPLVLSEWAKEKE